MNSARLIAFCIFVFVSVASAQVSLDSEKRINGKLITSAFVLQQAALQESSAVVYNGRDILSYGVVWSEDGFLLTKASQIAGVEKLNVRVDRKSYAEVEVVSVNKFWDCALLKIDAEGLVPAVFPKDGEPEIGSWVIGNGPTTRRKRRVAVGIVAALAREILPAGGATLGVTLKEEGMEITGLEDLSGAEAAGLRIGDSILAIDGEKVENLEGILAILTPKRVGMGVLVKVEREGEFFEMEVPIMAGNQVRVPLDRNDQMSGDFSKRRSSFPRIIQHSIIGRSTTMGGPILNFKGEIVGMNIARANRAETFAIPIKELIDLAEEMIAESRKVDSSAE